MDPESQPAPDSEALRAVPAVARRAGEDAQLAREALCGREIHRLTNAHPEVEGNAREAGVRSAALRVGRATGAEDLDVLERERRRSGRVPGAIARHEDVDAGTGRERLRRADRDDLSDA